MIRRVNILPVSHLLSIILLLATLTVAGTENYVHSGDAKYEISDDQSSNTETQTKLQVSAAVQSNFHVNLGFDSFLLEEVAISLVNDLPLFAADQFVPSVSKSFKILLQRIISTNAP